MRIREAKICFDCDFISVGPHCPICGKEIHWHLSTWLDRRPDDDIAKTIEHKIASINAQYLERLR